MDLSLYTVQSPKPLRTRCLFGKKPPFFSVGDPVIFRNSSTLYGAVIGGICYDWPDFTSGFYTGSDDVTVDDWVYKIFVLGPCNAQGEPKGDSWASFDTYETWVLQEDLRASSQEYNLLLTHEGETLEELEARIGAKLTEIDKKQ